MAMRFNRLGGPPGMIFGAAALLLFGIAAWLAYRQNLIIQTWPAIDAEVTASRVLSDQGGTYSAEIEFCYSIRNEQFTTRRGAGYQTASYSLARRSVDA